MNNIPYYVYFTFLVTLFATIYIFFRATSQSKLFVVIISAWIFIQTILGYFGFYSDSLSKFPKVQFILLPQIIFILIKFITPNGKKFIGSLNLKTLSFLHIVRLPVEIVLYWLFVFKTVPESMTFEGRNLDVFSGLTAPIIYYFGFVKNKLPKLVIICWNFLCLCLLVNIIVIGMLSTPTPFQQFGFEQPNIAVLHFPFMFLPACIVPLVLFSHLASIKQLIYHD